MTKAGIDRDTQLYVSAAGRPGNFGATLYNRLFRDHGINAVYLPRRAEAVDALALVAAVRVLGIAGCNVSMPLKAAVIPHLDELDEVPRRTGSVNTIAWRDGRLRGYDTDSEGARGAMARFFAEKRPKRVVVYGAGSVTGSVLAALKAVGAPEIVVTARRPERAAERARLSDVASATVSEAAAAPIDLLINATPAGVDEHHDDLWALLARAGALFDLVVSPTPTPLLAAAAARGLPVIPGVEMSKRQFQTQFEIHTGILPDLASIDVILRESYLAPVG